MRRVVIEHDHRGASTPLAVRRVLVHIEEPGELTFSSVREAFDPRSIRKAPRLLAGSIRLERCFEVKPPESFNTVFHGVLLFSLSTLYHKSSKISAALDGRYSNPRNFRVSLRLYRQREAPTLRSSRNLR